MVSCSQNWTQGIQLASFLYLAQARTKEANISIYLSADWLLENY
jgi:hypothetical protein